jgi:nucleotide-binding universal stress UspA family protein
MKASGTMKNILAAIDFADLTGRIMDTTAELAHSEGAKVWLLHCVEQPPFVYSMIEPPVSFPMPQSHLPDVHPEEHRQLAALNIELQQRGIDSEILFVGGDPSEEILQAAATHGIDLIILGSHGHGAIYDLIMGSVTKSVLYYTSIPTMIVPSHSKLSTEAISGDFVRDYSSTR